MVPLHKVHDPEKVARLAESMEQEGWLGAPLVKWDIYKDLLTGVHRYAAARSIGWSDYEIPMIDISDVFVEAGMDFDQILEKYGNPYLTDDAFLQVLAELPEDVANKYGIDMH